MRYYTVVNNNEVFNKYIKESNAMVALISFCDEDFKDIYNCLKNNSEATQMFDEGMLSVVMFEFVGEDNYLYEMSYATAEVKRDIKWPLKKIFEYYKNYEKHADGVQRYNKDIEQNYKEDTLIQQRSFIPNYQKYKFVDKENIVAINFRFKQCSKKEKMPLVIYFHGAGSVGTDNIKQFAEYKFLSLGLSKRNCHILVPQCAKEIGLENTFIIKTYCKSIKKLVDNLPQNLQIDFDRIYIIGASYGGACVWYSLYQFPQFYAGAIPLMGYFPEYNSNTFDVTRFAHENIWIGHSANDSMVPIKDDATMFEKLKNLKYNVKMTTYKKYGHGMSCIFIRREHWKKWLFEQKKSSEYDSI